MDLVINNTEIRTDADGLVSLNDIHAAAQKVTMVKYDGHGHVYVLDLGDGTCKVGSSRDPVKRLYALAAARSTDFNNVFVSDATAFFRQAETVAHSRLRPRHVRREIFRVPFELAISATKDAIAEAEGRARAQSIDALSPGKCTAHDVIAGICHVIEQGKLSELAETHDLSEDALALLARIEPSLAAVALAQALAGDAPNAEIAYASAVFDRATPEQQQAVFEKYRHLLAV